MTKISNLKLGNFIRFNNNIVQIIKIIHRTPGKGCASYQVKMKNFQNNKLFVHKFRPDENVCLEYITCKNYQYMYQNNKYYLLIDNTTLEEYEINNKLFVCFNGLIKKGINLKIFFDSENTPFFVQLPIHVQYTIIDTETAVKGNTAVNTLKNATIESGLVIKVPFFISKNDSILLDTRSKTYISKI